MGLVLKARNNVPSKGTGGNGDEGPREKVGIGQVEEIGVHQRHERLSHGSGESWKRERKKMRRSLAHEPFDGSDAARVAFLARRT